jgi:hypothetical protein
MLKVKDMAAGGMERAMQLITGSHPTLTPALNQTDIGAWHS